MTSSLYYPRSNGEAEQGLKTMKGLLKKDDKLYLMHLANRSTSLANRYSHAKLLINRRFVKHVPSFKEAWNTHISDRKLLVDREEELKRKQKILLIGTTRLEICRDNFLENWHGYLTGAYKVP